MPFGIPSRRHASSLSQAKTPYPELEQRPRAATSVSLKSRTIKIDELFKTSSIAFNNAVKNVDDDDEEEVWGTPIDSNAIESGLVCFPLTPPESPQNLKLQPSSTNISSSQSSQGFLARRTSLLFNRKVGQIVEEEEEEGTFVPKQRTTSATSSPTTSTNSPRTLFRGARSRRPKTSPPSSDDRLNPYDHSTIASSSQSNQEQIGQPTFLAKKTLRPSQSYSSLVLQKRNKFINENEWGRTTFTSAEAETVPNKPSFATSNPTSVSSTRPFPPTPPTSVPSSPSDVRRTTALMRSRSPSLPRNSSKVQWLQDQGRLQPSPMSSSSSPSNSSLFTDWSEVDRAISTPSPRGSSLRPRMTMVRSWSKDSNCSETSEVSGTFSGSSLSYESPLTRIGRVGSSVRWEKGYQEKNRKKLVELEIEDEEQKELLDSSSSVYSQEDSFVYSSNLSSQFPIPPNRCTSLDEKDLTWPDSPLSRSQSPSSQPSTSILNHSQISSQTQTSETYLQSKTEKEDFSSRCSRSGSGDSALSDETEGIVKAFLLNSSRRRRKDDEATFGLEAELLLHHRTS